MLKANKKVQARVLFAAVCPMGTGDSFSWVKAAVAWIWPFMSIEIHDIRSNVRTSKKLAWIIIS